MQEPEQSLRTLGGTVHCGPVKERNDVILYLLHRMIYILLSYIKISGCSSLERRNTYSKWEKYSDVEWRP